MQKRILLIFCFVLAVFAISACSDGKDGVDGKDATAEPEVAMSTRGCVTCHSAQVETLGDSKHIYQGFEFSASGTNPACLECHKPDIDVSYVNNAFGGVSCTSCHEFNGSVKNNPIHASYASNSDNCNKCHNDLSSHWVNGGEHAAYFPYSTGINAKFGTLEDSMPGHSNASGKAIRETDPRACGLCHSGAVFSAITVKVSPRKAEKTTLADDTVVYRTKGGGDEKLYANFDTYAENAANQHLSLKGSDTINCDGCHKTHATDGKRSLRADDSINEDTSKVVASNEFLLCTSCHLANVDIAADGKSATINPLLFGTPNADGILPDIDSSYIEHHATGSRGRLDAGSHTILDTHFKGKIYTEYAVQSDGKVKVVDAAIIDVKGYGIYPASVNACTSCHDAHSSSIFAPTKDSQEYKGAAETWAKSKHARDKFATRTDCAPCHGNRSFATAVMGKDEFILTAVAKVSTAPQQACLTCHEGSSETIDNATVITGANVKKLRKIESAETFEHAFNFKITPAQFDAVKAKYPAENVMLCAGCHAGSRNNDTVANAFEDKSDSGLTIYRDHYNVFGTFTGLTFDLETNLPVGKVYSDGGPLAKHMPYVQKDGCLSCHTADGSKHDFWAYVDNNNNTDGTGMKIANVSDDCKLCHPNGAMDDAGITSKNHVESLIKVAKAIAKNANTLTNAIEADPIKRKAIGIALGNIVALKSDSALYAHSNKTFIRQLFYDNLLVLQDYIGITVTPSMDLTGIKEFKGDKNGNAVSLTPTDIDNIKFYFSGFTR